MAVRVPARCTCTGRSVTSAPGGSANNASSDRLSSVTMAHRVATDGWASPRSSWEGRAGRDAEPPRERPQRDPGRLPLGADPRAQTVRDRGAALLGGFGGHALQVAMPPVGEAAPELTASPAH
jgi:hypothetical protein